MFARFVCALLSFRAREFPAKSVKNSGHLSLTAGRILWGADSLKMGISRTRDPGQTKIPEKSTLRTLSGQRKI